MVLRQVSEIGGGSIRIHRTELQERVLATLGIEHEEAHAKFGFLLEAASNSARARGGIAFGLDRICAIITIKSSCRFELKAVVPAHGISFKYNVFCCSRFPNLSPHSEKRLL